MKTKSLIVWLVFLCWCCVGLVAQTNTPPAGEGSAGAFSLPQTYVAVATPILTLLLTAFIAKIKPQLTLPVVAMIVTTLGTLLGALGTVVVGGDVKSIGTIGLTAGLALSGVAIKVVVDKLGEKPPQ